MKINIKDKINFILNKIEFPRFRIIILIQLIILLTPDNAIFSIIKKTLHRNYIYNKKSILFISPTFGGGGAERVACRLASEFSKRHKVYLIYFSHSKKEYTTIEYMLIFIEILYGKLWLGMINIIIIKI